MIKSWYPVWNVGIPELQLWLKKPQWSIWNNECNLFIHLFCCLKSCVILNYVKGHQMCQPVHQARTLNQHHTMHHHSNQ